MLTNHTDVLRPYTRRVLNLSSVFIRNNHFRIFEDRKKATGFIYLYIMILNYYSASCEKWMITTMVTITKDVRELSWMSHGVMRFWFLLNFLFISAFSDILASLSISRVFPSRISGRWKFSCSDIPRTIIKFDYIN